jgi:hypothetical protein
MKFALYIVTLFFSLNLFSVNSLADESEEKTAVATGDEVLTGKGTPLSEEELDRYIGRYGEAEEVPEGFQFNNAEVKLWLSDHLGNIKQPQSLYYEFVKSGSLEDGFSDSVYLKILKLNEDGTKNAMLDFFTAERKQAVNPDNVTNIVGNPVLGIFMQGDVYEMNRLTDGHWRYFHKQIKVALRESAVIEPVTFNFKGKEYKGEKVYFSPYLNDPHRRDFEKYADKYYEFIFSDDIPGSLFQITTIIPDKSKEEGEPLVLETLTLIDVKTNES